MSHQLTFRLLHEYDTGFEGISFDAILSHTGKQTRVKTKLDAGASFCIFQREHGEELGIESERGTKQRIGTATGSFIAYVGFAPEVAFELKVGRLSRKFEDNPLIKAGLFNPFLKIL